MIESLAPRVGLEPTTLRLTAECSTIELSRNIKRHVPSKPHIVLHPFFLNHCRKFELIFIRSNDQRTLWTLRGGQLESASLLLAAFRFANVMSHLSASQNVNILLRLQLLHAALQVLWSSPRPISDSQLHALPHFHLCPIYLVVFKGSYSFRWDISSWGGLHA